MKRKSSKNPFAVLSTGLLILIAVLLFAYQLYQYLGYQVPSPLNNFSAPSPITFVTLDDPALEFTMDYPSSWNLLRLPSGDHGDLTVKDLITTSTGFGVRIHDFGASNQLSLSKLISEKHLQEQKRKAQIDRQLTFELLSEEPVEIDQTAAFISTFKSVSSGRTIFDSVFGPIEPDLITEVAFRTDQKAYIISFQATESGYPRLKNIFQQMIDSIHIRVK